MNNDAAYASFLAQVQTRQQQLTQTLSVLLKTSLPFKTLEIGSGHGDFLVHYSQQFPDRFCCGIDLITQRIATSQRKAQRLNLPHCHFLKARAEEFLACQSADIFWNEVIILYPDPWPKRRHHKHRLFQFDFLNLLAQHVVSQAKIHFETDDAEYFHQVTQLIQAHPYWEFISCESYTVDTVFSRLTGSKGLHAVFQKSHLI